MVLIDMEMPESCGECPFVRKPELVSAGQKGLYEYISCCNKAPIEIDDPWRSIVWQAENREEWCPLKPFTPPEPQITTNIYDQEEIHHNCTVQVLRNSMTGDVSVGWWEESEEDTMSKEYIEREVAIEKLNEHLYAMIDGAPISQGTKDIYEMAYRHVEDVLRKAIPAADVRPVARGRWIDHQMGRWVYAKCSECETVHDVRSNYCPNCGAKMDGGTDNG